MNPAPVVLSFYRRQKNAESFQRIQFKKQYDRKMNLLKMDAKEIEAEFDLIFGHKKKSPVC